MNPVPFLFTRVGARVQRSELKWESVKIPSSFITITSLLRMTKWTDLYEITAFLIGYVACQSKEVR